MWKKGPEDGEGDLPFILLKIGFHDLDTRHHWVDTEFIHTKYHRRMARIIFNSEDGEAIADLLQAWTSSHKHHPLAHGKLQRTWALHLVRLQDLVSTSERLRQLVIRSVACLGPWQVGQVGAKKFIALLSCLDVGFEDVDGPSVWLDLLIFVITDYPQERRFLPHSYWILMANLAIENPGSSPWGEYIDRGLQVMSSLEKAREWDKLACWSIVVWLLRWLKIGTVPEDMKDMTLSLFRERPDAVRKIEESLSTFRNPNAPKCLERLRSICGLGVASRQYTP